MNTKAGEATTVSWKVGGMDCASCAAKISGALDRLPGVSDIKVSVMAETLSLSLDERKTDRAKIAAQIKALGYTADPITAKAAVPAATSAGGDPKHDP